jgi:hypothetical protein
VEACLRSQLTVASDFALDPESSRRYVNFGGQAWGRELEAFVPTVPTMLISRTTSWHFQAYHGPAKALVDEALRRIRVEQDEAGLSEPAAIGDETQQMLEEAARCMPELRFFLDLVKEWELVIYLLTHLARGTFAVPMAECLFVRSSGRSGKDTTANLMCAVLGTYAHSVSYDSLCSVSSPDAPSPTFAALRARRFVAVREVGEQKLLPSVYKRFCDPNSELSGRNLYDAPVRFRPQFLPFFCSNKPLQMDNKDAAIRARTAVVDYSSIFTTTPSEANHLKWRNMDELILQYRPGVWWMLTRVYHHLLRDRPMRNVLPVPESSLDAQELDCRELLEDNWQSFVRCASPAKGPADAATAEDIEKQVANRLGVDRVAAQLLLQGRGFERVRSKAQGRNVYFYRYNFSVCGAKVLKPLYVKMVA